MQRIDLTGQRFKCWTVISYAGMRNDNACWHCRCDCGTEKIVGGLSLRDGRSGSCGCHRRNWRRLDLTGKRFHLLTAIEAVAPQRSKSGRLSRWRCRCDCGEEKIIMAASLVYGATRSCGRCLSISHGESSGAHQTTEYRSWTAMMSRCQNPQSDSWANYGGRGITVCKRWQKYKNFLADMGRKPSPTYSIDRINVNGNYEPSNCRWATKKQQSANRRPFKFGKIESFSDAELEAELQKRQAVRQARKPRKLTKTRHKLSI